MEHLIYHIGIVGLGLIGGSFARAYRAAGHRVYVRDISPEVCTAALTEGAADGLLDDAPALDCLILALYPAATIACLRELADESFLTANTLVIDTCGIKREVCEKCSAIAQTHGFAFLGGHPMAGSHHSGFGASRADLFAGASMILVPPHALSAPEPLLERARTLLTPLGFGRFTVCTPERHDAMIAYTSQLAHVVSNAYVKSPAAQAHAGFSAGSYRDLTRVAYLNAPMWTELFLANRDNLLTELDTIIASLGSYRDALRTADADTLCRLLEEGKRCKKEAQ